MHLALVTGKTNAGGWIVSLYLHRRALVWKAIWEPPWWMYRQHRAPVGFKRTRRGWLLFLHFLKGEMVVEYHLTKPRGIRHHPYAEIRGEYDAARCVLRVKKGHRIVGNLLPITFPPQTRILDKSMVTVRIPALDAQPGDGGKA